MSYTHYSFPKTKGPHSTTFTMKVDGVQHGFIEQIMNDEFKCRYGSPQVTAATTTLNLSRAKKWMKAQHEAKTASVSQLEDNNYDSDAGWMNRMEALYS